MQKETMGKRPGRGGQDRGARTAEQMTGRGGGHDRGARTAEQMNEGRGDGGLELSLRGSLRSKLAPLLGMLAYARYLVTARRGRLVPALHGCPAPLGHRSRVMMKKGDGRGAHRRGWPSVQESGSVSGEMLGGEE